ncbi:MAG: hypothetical protein JO000_19440, partial [Alphaproteobacteria bacterium]|nr:hypothetical protein [Alphaproteobacteria bacterium]
LAVAAVALVLAILTYVFVEQPIRAWRLRRKPRAMPVIAAMAAACLLVGAGGFAWTRYELPRLMPELAGLKPAVAVAARAPSGAASASPQSKGGRGWLLGDSEAWNLQSALETRAAGAGADLSTSFKFGCPPIIGVDMVDHFGDRVVVCNEMFSNLDLSGRDFAVLFARWNLYLGLPQSDPLYPPFRLASEDRREVATSIALMRRGLASVVARAHQAGAQRILLIGQIPEFPLDPPTCVARALRLGRGSCAITRSAADARSDSTMEMMRELAGKTANVRLIDPAEVFCNATTCAPNDGRMLLYADPAHLSPAGIDRLYQHFRADFEWAFGAADRVTAQSNLNRTRD